MKLARDWVTPLTIGSFALLAVTGMLMFFHLESGLNKLAHEWLSWLLVAAVVGHAVVNFGALKRYFAQRRAQVIMGLLAVALIASFAPLGGKENRPPFMAPVEALARAPLPVLAQVAGVSEAEMGTRLRNAGVTLTAEAPTLADVADHNPRREMELLNKLLATPPK